MTLRETSFTGSVIGLILSGTSGVGVVSANLADGENVTDACQTIQSQMMGMPVGKKIVLFRWQGGFIGLWR